MDLPRETCVQIVVTGEDVRRLRKILDIVTTISVPGIHDTEELGGERPMAQRMLDGIDVLADQRNASRGRQMLREWLVTADTNDVETMARVIRAIGMEVPW